MKIMYSIIAIAGILGIGWFLMHTSAPTYVTNTLRHSDSDSVDINHKPIPLEEKVGQLFMIGHWAHTPVASTTALLEATKAGGVIMMSTPGNPAVIRDWVAEWSSVATTPLLIGIDQEGGTVSRLRGADFISTGQRDISTVAMARGVAEERGQELAALGINLNFAPVLDSAISKDAFMYQRVFTNRHTSARLAQEMISGFAQHGVIGVAKHFPGHGDDPADSHYTLPIVDIGRDELDEFTEPFRDFVVTNPPALMTAHVLFPQLDDKPATLSSFFLTDYLRTELGFDGVVITDDMIMDAIDQTWPTPEATVLSIQAGADIVLFAAEPEEVIAAQDYLLKQIEAGHISREKIDEAYQRVMRLKKDSL